MEPSELFARRHGVQWISNSRTSGSDFCSWNFRIEKLTLRRVTSANEREKQKQTRMSKLFQWQTKWRKRQEWFRCVSTEFLAKNKIICKMWMFSQRRANKWIQTRIEWKTIKSNWSKKIFIILLALSPFLFLCLWLLRTGISFACCTSALAAYLHCFSTEQRSRCRRGGG